MICKMQSYVQRAVGAKCNTLMQLDWIMAPKTRIIWLMWLLLARVNFVTTFATVTVDPTMSFCVGGACDFERHKYFALHEAPWSGFWSPEEVEKYITEHGFSFGMSHVSSSIMAQMEYDNSHPGFWNQDLEHLKAACESFGIDDLVFEEQQQQQQQGSLTTTQALLSVPAEQRAVIWSGHAEAYYPPRLNSSNFVPGLFETMEGFPDCSNIDSSSYSVNVSHAASAEWWSSFLKECAVPYNIAYGLHLIELADEYPSKSAELCTSIPELANRYRVIKAAVEKQYPYNPSFKVHVGGPGSASPKLNGTELADWVSNLQIFLENGGKGLDFLSGHIYGANYARARAILDLVEALSTKVSNATTPMPYILSGYGLKKWSEEDSSQEFTYSWERDWDELVAYNMMITEAMARPDRLVRAVPDLQLQSTGCDEGVAGVLHRRCGSNKEATHLVKFLDLWQDFGRGEGAVHVMASSSSRHIRAHAVSSDSSLQIVMTNLLDEDMEAHMEIPQLLQVTGETFFYARLQQLIFSESAAAPTLLSTTIVFTVTDPYVFTLTPHQTAIISIDLPGPTEMASSVSEVIYYAEQMMVPFAAYNFTAFDLSINVTNSTKLQYARARIGLWGQAEDVGTELLYARWNNGSSLISAAEDAEAGQRLAPPFNNDDSAFLTGVELSIPVELVTSGANQIELYFSGSGVVTSVVLVLGEGEPFNNSLSDLSNITWPPPYTPGIPIPPVSPPSSPLLSPPAASSPQPPSPPTAQSPLPPSEGGSDDMQSQQTLTSPPPPYPPLTTWPVTSSGAAIRHRDTAILMLALIQLATMMILI